MCKQSSICSQRWVTSGWSNTQVLNSLAVINTCVLDVGANTVTGSFQTFFDFKHRGFGAPLVADEQVLIADVTLLCQGCKIQTSLIVRQCGTKQVHRVVHECICSFLGIMCLNALLSVPVFVRLEICLIHICAIYMYYSVYTVDVARVWLVVTLNDPECTAGSLADFLTLTRVLQVLQSWSNNMPFSVLVPYTCKCTVT